MPKNTVSQYHILYNGIVIESTGYFNTLEDARVYARSRYEGGGEGLSLQPAYPHLGELVPVNDKRSKNTVPEVVDRFLRSPHREKFVEMCGGNIAVAAVVYFRRATAYKNSYTPAEYTQGVMIDGKMDWPCNNPDPWHARPVCPVRTGDIKTSTLVKYGKIISELEGAE